MKVCTNFIREMSSSFASTLSTFCGELRATFPELGAAIDRAATLTPDHFWRLWKSGLGILLARDSEALLKERKGFVISTVRLTPALWSEISENTRTAIWRYLRTLVLEAAMEISLDGLDAEALETLNAILVAERLEKGGAEAEAATSEMFEEGMAHLKPLMEKLKGMMGGFMDLSGLPDIKMPEIPEHLRNGRIAKLAEEMAKQLKPEEFGIDPALLKGDNVEEILKRLAEVYQKDPTLLISGAKRVAEKIKTQILGGSLNRDELVAEAQEFVALFKEHPMFKEALGKFHGLMGEGGLAAMFGGGGSEGAPSERRRAVQERLRKKLAARKGK
jgi:hypothetical protein